MSLNKIPIKGAEKKEEETWMKYVLKHMDAKQRIQRASEHSEFQKHDRIVQLVVGKLVLDAYNLTMDDGVYSTTLIRIAQETENSLQYPDAAIDVDNDGFEVQFPSSELTQGDIFVGSTPYSRARAERLDQEMTANTARMLLENRVVMTKQLMLRAQDGSAQKEELCKEIEGFERLLHPHLCRQRRNIILPPTPYIKISCPSPTGQTTEVFAYNRPLFHAIKNITNKILGDRSVPIKVGILVFPQRDVIIRLSPGTTFVIEHLVVPVSIPGFSVTLKSIVEQESFPLKSLTYQITDATIHDFNHPIVHGAQHLIIRSDLRPTKTWLPILQNLPNPNITLEWRYYFKPVEFAELVSHWVHNGKDRGTWMEIHFSTDERANRVLEAIGQEHFGGSQNMPRTIPIIRNGALLFTVRQLHEDEFGNICSLRIESINRTKIL